MHLSPKRFLRTSLFLECDANPQPVTTATIGRFSGQTVAVKFSTGYDVTIGRPVDEVFRTLALSDDLERLLRLSPLVTKFRLLDTQPGPTPTTQVITFEFGERVPMLPGGLYSTNVTMRVEQTVDSETHRVDYWSQTKGGAKLSVHKVRTFEPVGDATKVVEVIDGDAPFGVHLIAGRTARKAHIEHMDSYHKLFEARRPESAHHPVVRVRGVRRADDVDHLEVDVVLEPVEEPLAAAEDHRRRRDDQLVDPAGRQALADQVRSPAEAHVAVAGRLDREVEGVVEAGDEVEAALDRRLVLEPVRQHHHRPAERVGAAPRARGVVHPAAADAGAEPGDQPVEELLVGASASRTRARPRRSTDRP